METLSSKSTHLSQKTELWHTFSKISTLRRWCWYRLHLRKTMQTTFWYMHSIPSFRQLTIVKTTDERLRNNHLCIKWLAKNVFQNNKPIYLFGKRSSVYCIVLNRFIVQHPKYAKFYFILLWSNGVKNKKI